MRSADPLQSLLYSALASPLGLLIRTDDFDRLRRDLYAARARAKDPALRILAFRATGGEAALAIVKVGGGGGGVAPQE